VLLALVMLAFLVPTTASASQKVSHSESRGGIDGLDPNPLVGEHNSYAWCSELFHQTQGDYLWVGMNRDLAGNILARAATPTPGMFTVFNIPEPNGDMAGRIYRQRASDPEAPWELVYASPLVSGFRRMIVFNDDLYVVGATTNTPVADYSMVFRFSKDFKPGDKPEIVLWDNLPTDGNEHFRAATSTDDQLFIGTFDSKIYVTDGSGLKNLTPNAGENHTGWDLLVDFSEYGWDDSVWDILAFNGSVYAFLAYNMYLDPAGVTKMEDIDLRGFRVVKVTPTANGVDVKEIVGDDGQYPFGMGWASNASASGFLSTSFEKDYVYVTTFASGPAIAVGILRGLFKEAFTYLFSPAQIYRFDANDKWEVLVGDTQGDRVAVDSTGKPVPHVGNQRAGFSLLPDDQPNVSFNQYTWWMTEHEGKMYATTWDMSTFKDQYAIFTNRYIDTIIPGSAAVLNPRYADLAKLHFLLMRDAHLIDFPAMTANLDAYLATIENTPAETPEQLRAQVQGAVGVIARGLPTADFRAAILWLIDIIIDVINETDDVELTTREIAALIMDYFEFSSGYFSDASNPAGFDLFVTEDGKNFEPVTVDGFGDKYNYGGRVMVSSEHGLNVMTANPFNGGQVWRADPMELGVYPNGPTGISLSTASSTAMTVLVTDARASTADLKVTYDSDIVSAQLIKRTTKDVNDISWDNQIVNNPAKGTREYKVTENVVPHQSDVYDLVLTPKKTGTQDLTLTFSIGSVAASRTIAVNVNTPTDSDKGTLASVLNEASFLNRSDYDRDSWTVFLMAYTDALTVYNTDASQSEIGRVTTALVAAMEGLVPIAPPEGYTVISTEDQLRAMKVSGKYWLANDIELTKPWAPIAHFTGTLDGNGHTISNLTINNPNLCDQGMFRYATSGASFKDLELVVGDGGVKGYCHVGALIGLADGVTIMGVRVELGDNGVNGFIYVGGLVGRANNSVIGGSFVYGRNGLNEIYAGHPQTSQTIQVQARYTVDSWVGGLVGYSYHTGISSSASYVNVSGYSGVGGLVGYAYGTGIENSFARGYVHGLTTTTGTAAKPIINYGENIGGLIGTVAGTSAMENVYATGVVESNGKRRINPLIGYASSRPILRGHLYYDSDVAAKSTTKEQDMTNIPQDNRLHGVPTSEMKKVSTFTKGGATWDFDTIFDIGWFNGTPAETATYPYFKLGIALQSTPPIIRGVTASSSTVSGVGTTAAATISVTLPDGTTLETETDENLEWTIEVPPTVTLNEGDEIKVVQSEDGLDDSQTAVVVVDLTRPIDITATIDTQNLGDATEVRKVGDKVRYSVTVFNDGFEEQWADRLQVVDVMPGGMALVPGSVRYTTSGQDGPGASHAVPQNSSAASVRGYSYNATTQKLEIRLGDVKLSGGQGVTIEFDLVVEAKVAASTLRSTEVIANRVSMDSTDNTVIAWLLTDSLGSVHQQSEITQQCLMAEDPDR